MTREELGLFGEMLATEQTALTGPPCEDGGHQVHGDDDRYSRCKICYRTLMRADAQSPWQVTHMSGCECRECRARWSKPTDAAPRFEMSAVGKGSLVTLDPGHYCGTNGVMGTGTQGRWRVTGFWRLVRKGDEGYTMRHEGQTLVQCESGEALYVSMTSVCGIMLRTDDFLAHATITGHLIEGHISVG